MRQWDILLFPFREELPHPAVIITNDVRMRTWKWSTR